MTPSAIAGAPGPARPDPPAETPVAPRTAVGWHTRLARLKAAREEALRAAAEAAVDYERGWQEYRAWQAGRRKKGRK